MGVALRGKEFVRARGTTIKDERLTGRTYDSWTKEPCSTVLERTPVGIKAMGIVDNFKLHFEAACCRNGEIS